MRYIAWVPEDQLRKQSQKVSNYRKQIKQMQGAIAKWKARALQAEMNLAVHNQVKMEIVPSIKERSG